MSKGEGVVYVSVCDKIKQTSRTKKYRQTDIQTRGGHHTISSTYEKVTHYANFIAYLRIHSNEANGEQEDEEEGERGRGGGTQAMRWKKMKMTITRKRKRWRRKIIQEEIVKEEI